MLILPRCIKYKQSGIRRTDIQAHLSGTRTTKIDADEEGTEKVKRRFMIKGAEYNSTQELGL